MAEYMDYLNDPAIADARAQSQAASQTATNYASAASLLPSKLRQAVQEKLDYNKDIIEQKNKAMSEYFQAPSKAREEYSDIWNPIQREKLVAASRAMAYQPYANLIDILNNRMGTISDIINAGTGSFQSAVTGAQGAANIARQSYEDVYQSAKERAAAAFQAAQAEQEQKNWEKEYALKEYSAKKPSGSGSGSVLTGLGDIIKTLFGGAGNPNVLPQTSQSQSNPVMSVYPKVQEGLTYNSGPGQLPTDGLTYLSGPGSKFSIKYPQLKDPRTGNVYSYSGEYDPDYISDRNSGFIPM